MNNPTTSAATYGVLDSSIQSSSITVDNSPQPTLNELSINWYVWSASGAIVLVMLVCVWLLFSKSSSPCRKKTRSNSRAKAFRSNTQTSRHASRDFQINQALLPGVNREQAQPPHYSSSKSPGGIVVGPGGRVVNCECFTVEIPPGALPQTTVVKVRAIDGEGIVWKGKQYLSLSKVLSCTPTGLKFSKPYTVTLRTCYAPTDKSKPIPLTVFVRPDSSQPWEPESDALLKANGKVVFKADHFTDWAAEPDEHQWPRMTKYLGTFGFVKAIAATQKSLTLYFIDSVTQSSPDADDHTFKRIRSLHDKDDLVIPYAKIGARIDKKLHIKMQPEDPNSATLDPAMTTIYPRDIRPSDIAINREFLISSRSPSNSGVMVCKYNILNLPEENCDGTTNNNNNNDGTDYLKGGRFFVSWGVIRSDSVTSLKLGHNSSVIIGPNGTIRREPKYQEASATTSSNLPGTSRQVNEHGTSRQVNEHGTSRRVNEHGTSRQVNEHGTSRRVNEHGTSRRVNPPQRQEHITGIPAARVQCLSSSSSSATSPDSTLERNDNRTSARVPTVLDIVRRFETGEALIQQPYPAQRPQTRLLNRPRRYSSDVEAADESD